MSTLKLKEGVYLHTLPTTQFATTRILVNFTNQHDLTTLGGRVLATNMIETVSATLPSQAQFARALSRMYGADFGTDVMKTGALHTIRLRMTLVDDAFATDTTSLLADGFAFLNDVMFSPMGDATNGFDPTVFGRQRDISLDEIAGLQEDRAFYAARQAMNEYFEETTQAVPAYGTAELLANTSALDAWQAWEQAKQHDRIDIIVLGDVSEAEVAELAGRWDFADREVALNPYYDQALWSSVKTAYEVAPVNQARLILGYQLHVNQEDRFKAFVFNALFGGLAVSRLFLNVRESAGLAYSIYSDFNQYTDLLLVEAGVDHQKLQEAETRIDEELTRMQTELVPDEELTMIKRLMVADYQAALDQPARVTERIMTQQLVGYATTPDEWMAYLNAVTAEDLRQLAQGITKQLHFELIGGVGNHDEQ